MPDIPSVKPYAGATASSAESPYSAHKLLWHEEALQHIERGRQAPLIQVHLMPSLICNQRCSFCAYQARDDGDVEGWKNRQLVNQRQHMDPQRLRDLVIDFARMGVQAVELTGGGEPLTQPGLDDFLRDLAQTDIRFALVTNGTRLDAPLADLIAATEWRWARVSIDAGDRQTYMRVRRCGPAHWVRAWQAVELLAERRDRISVLDRVQRVGVGYVVDAENYEGVYEGVRLAREHGADNVRLSVAFTPEGLSRFPDDALPIAIEQARAAVEDFSRHDFAVHDLISERGQNLLAGAQDYKLCAWKEVGCVIGGDLNIYACCSWAFNPAGLVASFKGCTFEQAWNGDQAREWRRQHDARRDCPIECLYEQRNKRALEMIDAGATRREQMRAALPEPPHIEFI